MDRSSGTGLAEAIEAEIGIALTVAGPFFFVPANDALLGVETRVSSHFAE